MADFDYGSWEADLVIDDDYLDDSGDFYYKMGEKTIDKMVDDYLTKLQEVKDTGLISGATATALDKFITSANILKDEAGSLAIDAESLLDSFKTEIDTADSFLF